MNRPAGAEAVDRPGGAEAVNGPTGRPFGTVLVANRGEIAVRVIRTLTRLGIRSVAVFSDADAGAPHVRAADVAIRLGPTPPAASYLDGNRVLDAAARAGADAIHPGYGFLSENAAFARACAAAGVSFVGPPAAAIEAMGDKITAKQTVAVAGVPVVPGVHRAGLDDAALRDAAAEVGYPLMVKAAAGGGGKGMRVVRDAGGLAEALAAARREASSAFGDDALLLERLVERPRHLEIQVLADTHGTCVHLGERECSLQRRHQKIVEECPSPSLDEATRARMGAAAIAAAQACGYTGAGTVEFIAPAADPSAFFFLEMNTRLQVEHPVTEAVYGVDLVEWQLRVAAGEVLALTKDELRPQGHAIEARVYAEDPARGFLPTGGTVVALREPTSGRIDSGIAVGSEIGSVYDPLLAKLVAHAPDRTAALRQLDGMLAGYTLLGVTTNVAFLRALLADPDVRAGTLDTGLVERRQDALVADDVPQDVYVAAALLHVVSVRPQGPVIDPFVLQGGWRIGAHAWTRLRLIAPGAEAVDVRVRGRLDAAEVSVGDGAALAVTAQVEGATLRVAIDGAVRSYVAVEDGDVAWIGRDGRVWALREESALAAARHVHDGTTSGELLAPMPGTVAAVTVAVGDDVAAGQPLVVVEAMKMEHPVVAPSDGRVARVDVTVGQAVRMDQPLALVEPVGKEQNA